MSEAVLDRSQHEEQKDGLHAVEREAFPHFCEEQCAEPFWMALEETLANGVHQNSPSKKPRTR
jgi:hypothetical protein